MFGPYSGSSQGSGRVAGWLAVFYSTIWWHTVGCCGGGWCLLLCFLSFLCTENDDDYQWLGGMRAEASATVINNSITGGLASTSGCRIPKFVYTSVVKGGIKWHYPNSRQILILSVHHTEQQLQQRRGDGGKEWLRRGLWLIKFHSCLL